MLRNGIDRRGRLAVIVSTLSVGVALLGASAAQAIDITSAGPLTDISVGTNLSCQVFVAGDVDANGSPQGEFYDPADSPADCGTFVSTGGASPTLYEPGFAEFGPAGTAYSSGMQDPTVSGSGTSAHPYLVNTTVAAGTDLTVTETDSYVVGSGSFQTDIKLTAGSNAASGTLYRGADCYLQGSDSGLGGFDTTTHAPQCLGSPDNESAGSVEEFDPITPGANGVEDDFDTVWSDIGSQTALPNTCQCTQDIDNGMAIDWPFTIASGQSQTFSLTNSFVAAGGGVTTTTSSSSTAPPPVPTQTSSSTTSVTTTSSTTTSTSTTTSKAVPPPPPVLFKDENIAPVSGVVYVKLPAGATLASAASADSLPFASDSLTKGTGFVPLTQARQIPVGSVLDTTGGTVAITAASPTKGKFFTGQFTAGIFQLLQNRAEKGLTQVTLRDTVNRKKACVSVGKKASTASTKKKVSSKVLGLLKSTDNGKFSTRGSYSAATVRGTAYSVQDNCAGTLTTVTRGSVVVDYFRRHKMIVVKAGHAFLAKVSGGPSSVVSIGKQVKKGSLAALRPVL